MSFAATAVLFETTVDPEILPDGDWDMETRSNWLRLVANNL
jgi:hypothetical protein